MGRSRVAMAQILLEARVVLPQIMQEPSEFGFVSQTEGSGELFGQAGDLAEVRGERLPISFVRITRAARQFSRMCEKAHFTPQEILPMTPER
jgi:hypothetical protein